MVKANWAVRAVRGETSEDICVAFRADGVGTTAAAPAGEPLSGEVQA